MTLSDERLAAIREQASQAEEFITCNADVPIPEDVDRFFMTAMPLLLAELDRVTAERNERLTLDESSRLARIVDDARAELAQARQELNASVGSEVIALLRTVWRGTVTSADRARINTLLRDATPAAPVPAPASGLCPCGHDIEYHTAEDTATTRRCWIQGCWCDRTISGARAAAPVPAPADGEYRSVDGAPYERVDGLRLWKRMTKEDPLDRPLFLMPNATGSASIAITRDLAERMAAGLAADEPTPEQRARFQDHAEQLCSDKNGEHDGHDWRPDLGDLVWCPGYPVPAAPVSVAVVDEQVEPVVTRHPDHCDGKGCISDGERAWCDGGCPPPAAVAPAVTVQADGPDTQDGAGRG